MKPDTSPSVRGAGLPHYLLLILIAILIALVAVALASRGAGRSPDAFQQALDGCTACHGKTGVSTDTNVPNLRAQNYDYLVNQLTRFARLQPGSSTPGEAEEISPIVRGLESIRNRRSEIMEQHAAANDDPLLRELARHFSQLPCTASPRPSKVVPQPQGAAWCNDCHGPKKARQLQNVPLLNGQHADYLEAQLLAFKQVPGVSPSKDSRFHHFMSRSVRTMSGKRIRDVAEYYESLSCTG